MRSSSGGSGRFKVFCGSVPPGKIYPEKSGSSYSPILLFPHLYPSDPPQAIKGSVLKSVRLVLSFYDEELMQEGDAAPFGICRGVGQVQNTNRPGKMSGKKGTRRSREEIARRVAVSALSEIP